MRLARHGRDAFLAALAAATLTLGACTAAPTRTAATGGAPGEDPYLHAIKAVAMAHDAAGPGAGSAPLAELSRAIADAPAPKTREQRYVVARLLAYHSAALRAAGAGASLAAAAPATASEIATGLNEAYDLLAASERTFLQSSILWDRLRVKRRGALATDPAELKQRMTESESAVTAEFAEFD